MREVLQTEGIEKVYQFLEEAHLYYLATVEGDQPRQRADELISLSLPFGFMLRSACLQGILRMFNHPGYRFPRTLSN